MKARREDHGAGHPSAGKLVPSFLARALLSPAQERLRLGGRGLDQILSPRRLELTGRVFLQASVGMLLHGTNVAQGAERKGKSETGSGPSRCLVPNVSSSRTGARRLTGPLGRRSRPSRPARPSAPWRSARGSGPRRRARRSRRSAGPGTGPAAPRRAPRTRRAAARRHAPCRRRRRCSAAPRRWRRAGALPSSSPSSCRALRSTSVGSR